MSDCILLYFYDTGESTIIGASDTYSDAMQWAITKGILYPITSDQGYTAYWGSERATYGDVNRALALCTSGTFTPFENTSGYLTRGELAEAICKRVYGMSSEPVDRYAWLEGEGNTETTFPDVESYQFWYVMEVSKAHDSYKVNDSDEAWSIYTGS